MAAQSTRARDRSVTEPPGWEELAWDAVLAGASMVEAISPPVAVAGVAFNRLIHADRSVIGDAGGHVGHTLEAAFTEPPGWQELAWDTVLAGASMVEAISPPMAVAGAALNRLIHAAR